jgi:hypothetical protein
VQFPGLTDASGLPAPGATQTRIPAVQLRDVLPPFMTRAFFDGTQFVFEFDEAIDPTVGTITMVNCGASVSVPGSLSGAIPAANRASIGLGGRRLSVPRLNGAWAGLADPDLCFDEDLSYPEDPFYAFAAITAISNLPQGAVDVTPAHGFVDYSTVEDQIDNSDIGLLANSWANWASYDQSLLPGFQNFGLQNMQFAAANVIGEFQPVSIGRSNNYRSSPAASVGQGGDTINVTIEFSQPFFVDDGIDNCGLGVDGANCRAIPNVVDDFGDHADADDDGLITNTELRNWAALKFHLLDTDADDNGTTDAVATEITTAGADPRAGAQIVDSNGEDALTNQGNLQDATKIILTFALGSDVAAGDTVAIIPGSGLSSNFILTKTVVPFDESSAGAAVPGDNKNQRDELNDIPPLPATFGCPQVNDNGNVTSEC